MMFQLSRFYLHAECGSRYLKQWVPSHTICSPATGFLGTWSPRVPWVEGSGRQANEKLLDLPDTEFRVGFSGLGCRVYMKGAELRCRVYMKGAEFRV